MVFAKVYATVEKWIRVPKIKHGKKYYEKKKLKYKFQLQGRTRHLSRKELINWKQTRLDLMRGWERDKKGINVQIKYKTKDGKVKLSIPRGLSISPNQQAKGIPENQWRVKVTKHFKFTKPKFNKVADILRGLRSSVLRHKKTMEVGRTKKRVARIEYREKTDEAVYVIRNKRGNFVSWSKYNTSVLRRYV